MVTAAALSFIGAGTQPITPAGEDIRAEGRTLWQLKFFSATVLAVDALGDGLRDALDPRRIY